MKKEIIIYYKDSNQDEYVTRRVLTQDGNYYKLTSYWKKGKNIERYESKAKLTESEANKYILQCRKENRFDYFKYQFVLCGDKMYHCEICCKEIDSYEYYKNNGLCDYCYYGINENKEDDDND